MADPQKATLRSVQIINGALVQGILVFLVVAAFIRINKGQLLGPNPWDVSDPLVIGAIAMALGLSVLAGVLTRRIAVRTYQSLPADTRPGDPYDPEQRDRWLGLFQTSRIIELALIEGAAFFNTVVFLIQGNGICLALAIALMLTMLAGFPTSARLDRWIEHMRASN
jgi:hypothetical protein